MTSETVAGPPPPDTGLPMQLGVREWLILITLCAAQFMVALDFSIVTVALPDIGRSLQFGSTDSLQWVMTAFILPVGGLLLLFGRASDLLGRRRLFVTGLALVTAFSLLAGLATEPWMLVAARAGQGVGSAMVGPTALALLTTSFPAGPRRDKALGISGALLSLGFVVGTIGGGVITSGLNWRWTMLILVIMGAVVLVGALTLLDETRERGAVTRLDIPGAVLVTTGLVAVVYGISTGNSAGWASAPTLTALIAAVILLGAFLLVEARQSAPLAPLPILNRRKVKWGCLTGFITFGMCGGTTVLVSLYMQDVLQWSPLVTGVAFLGEGVAAMVAGTIASRLIGALTTPGMMTIGLVIQTVSTGAMVLLPVDGDLALLLIATSGLGFGHVLAMVAFMVTVTSGLASHEQGLAGGLAQTAQQLGSAIGVAGLAAVVTASMAPTVTPQATLASLHAGIFVAAVVTLAGAVVAASFLRRPTAAPEPEEAMAA